MKLYPIKQKITQVNMGGWIDKSNVKYLVFHFVGASGQALANANYFYNVNRNASAHVFIDSKEIYQVVPFNRVAWHVGKITQLFPTLNFFNCWKPLRAFKTTT